MRLIAQFFDLPPPAPRVAPSHTAQTIDNADGRRAEQTKTSATSASTDAEFWPIWLTHRDYLFRYSLRFSSGNAADAEDALSEATLKAAHAFPQAEIRSHRAWLLRLVYNACMDRHRMKDRQNRLMSEIADDDGQSIPAIVPKPNRSPDELLDALELVAGLRDAMLALPVSLAEPLLLYLDELPDADIAASLNVTKEVVRKRRQMARLAAAPDDAVKHAAYMPPCNEPTGIL